jgi:hypothetical protein
MPSSPTIVTELMTAGSCPSRWSTSSPSVNTEPTGIVVAHPCATVLESGPRSMTGWPPQPVATSTVASPAATARGPAMVT